MTRSLYAIPAMICLAAAAAAAQADKPAAPAAPASPPAAQQPARPSESTAASKVTYSGCVKPGTASGTWVLENAEAAQKAGASAPGGVGTSGASKMAFSLAPASSVNLTPHANHKVEVTGVVSAAKPAPEAGAAAGASSAPRQQIAVESVKMVSATCP
jgi:hypothetical protein